MKKIFTFTLALALASPLMAESLRIFKCSEDGIPGQTEPQLMGLSISSDGHYICGTIEQGAGIFAADCQTGLVKWAIGGDGGGELRGVNNDGVAIGFTDDGILYSFAMDEEVPFDVPEGIRSIIGESISNDGSVMVGSFMPQSFVTEAAYSIQGQPWKTLPLPTDEQRGVLKDYMNSESAAKFVSGDGSVILGHLGSFTFPTLWYRNAAGEYIPDFFPVRYVKAVEADRNDASKPLFGISGMYTCMSNNGKYVGTIGLIANASNTETRIVPVIYNTVDKTLKVYAEEQYIDELGIGLYPRAIANDGTFIGCVGSSADPAGNFGCFIMRAGEEQAELYLDAFPEFEKVLGESDALGQNIPTGISADGKHILGYTFYSEDYDLTSAAPAYFVSYVISLDGSGVEGVNAVESENAAAIYSIDGRKLTKLQKGINIVRNPDGSVTKIYGERSF